MSADTNGWQPISTAPKDGTKILTYAPVIPPHKNSFGGDPTAKIIINYRRKAEGGDRHEWWNSRFDQQPTHWMPLPSPPAA